MRKIGFGILLFLLSLQFVWFLVPPSIPTTTTNEVTMEKSQAAKLLSSNYTDGLGRATLYDFTEEWYKPSENHGLFTGEAMILLRANGLMEMENIWNFSNMMEMVQVYDKYEEPIQGLYARQPNHWEVEGHHNVSKDEYRGFAYGAAVTNNKRLMNEIIDYGRSNSWFYVDDDPNGGVNTDHMGAFRLPTDRALYKIVAGQDPNLLEILSLGITAILNSRKPKGDTSSKIMSWFGFKAIEYAGYNSKILNFMKKRFDKKLKEQYNREDYIHELINIYFQDRNHPFHALSKGLTL